MAWKKAGLVCIVLAALAIVGYAQTNTKPRAHSTNVGASSGYLGVGVEDLDAERVKALNLKDSSGVLVSGLAPGQAGELAGLHVNDVILEFNGQKVDSSEEFTESIIGKAPGTKVSLTVSRNGVKQTMAATLGVRPPGLPVTGPQGFMTVPMSPEAMQGLAAAAGVLEAPRAGFVGVELLPQLAEFFGVTQGVLVQSVNAKSAAERAGLKAGDIVTKVNGMPVASPREISVVLRQANKKIAAFTVVRNKKEVALNIEIAWNRPGQFEREAVN